MPETLKIKLYLDAWYLKGIEDIRGAFERQKKLRASSSQTSKAISAYTNAEKKAKKEAHVEQGERAQGMSSFEVEVRRNEADKLVVTIELNACDLYLKKMTCAMQCDEGMRFFSKDLTVIDERYPVDFWQKPWSKERINKLFKSLEKLVKGDLEEKDFESELCYSFAVLISEAVRFEPVGHLKNIIVNDETYLKKYSLDREVLDWSDTVEFIHQYVRKSQPESHKKVPLEICRYPDMKALLNNQAFQSEHKAHYVAIQKTMNDFEFLYPKGEKRAKP